MQTIAITTRHKLYKKEVLFTLIKTIQKAGKKILLDKNALRNYSGAKDDFEEYDFIKKVDLLFVLGGDGTVLRAVRHLSDLSTPMFGINAGHLGFLSEVQAENLQEVCLFLWNKQYTEDYRMLINIDIYRKGLLYKNFYALNEIVINQSALARLVELPTYVNDEPVAIYRADGLIIATPTGSTAYSLSAGGPILHPKIEAFVVTPVAPHSFTQKPIILTPEKIIKVIAIDRNREPVAITIDGQICEILEPNDEIIITKHPIKIKFLRLLEENFFRTLRTKLGWGEAFTE